MLTPPSTPSSPHHRSHGPSHIRLGYSYCVKFKVTREIFFFVAKCNRLVFFEHLLIVCIPPRPMSRAYPRVHWRNDYLRIQCRTLTPASTDAMSLNSRPLTPLTSRPLTQWCKLRKCPCKRWKYDSWFTRLLACSTNPRPLTQWCKLRKCPCKLWKYDSWLTRLLACSTEKPH